LIYGLWTHKEISYGFKRRRGGFLHLDKDDLGHRNDKIIINGEEKIIFLNREVVSIRGILPGEYITNVHAYRKMDKSPVNGYVRLLKLNPYVEYATEYFILKDVGDEVTAFRFEVDNDGYVTDINQDHHRFVTNRPHSGGIAGP